MADELATISIKASCPCGTRVTWPEGMADDFLMVCKGCGREIGTYRDFKAKMRERGREEARRIGREFAKKLSRRKF